VVEKLHTIDGAQDTINDGECELDRVPIDETFDGVGYERQIDFRIFQDIFHNCIDILWRKEKDMDEETR